MVWGQPNPLSLEENKTRDIGTDNKALPACMEIPTGVDQVLNRNSRRPQAVIPSNVKKTNIPPAVECDSDQDNAVNEVQYNNREISVTDIKSGNRLSQNQIVENPATEISSGTDDKSGKSESGSVTESTENPEWEHCMNTLTTYIKTENESDCSSDISKAESDCSTDISKAEPESKIIDDKSLNHESHARDKQMSPCHNNSKPSVQKTRRLTSISCKGCDRTFKMKSSYESHLKEGRCKLICQVCGKEFTGRNLRWGFDVHMRYHNKQKDQECKICGKMFIEKSKMVQHFKSHANPKFCDKCGKWFLNNKCLRKHMANMHVENRDKFQCSKCPKMYLSEAGFKYHMRTAHDSNIFFTCLTCNKTFKDRKLLQAHEVTHKDTRNFKCDQCDATFKRAIGLLAHQKRHKKAYILFCRTCKKGFYNKRQMQQHENIHSGLKPFACSICDYRCACESNLPKHMKIHHKE